MLKWGWVGLTLWAGVAQGAVLQDWQNLTPGQSAGSYADTQGSKLDIAQVEGPKAGEKALQVTANLVNYGGVWAAASGDLSQAKAIVFSAKSSVPGPAQFSLTDTQKTQVAAQIRLSENWSSFVLPLSLFSRTAYQAEGAPKNAAFEWAQVQSLGLAPSVKGKSVLVIGPVSSAEAALKTSTGFAADLLAKNQVLVQDFSQMEQGSYGTYNDGKSGSSLSFGVAKGPQGVVSYELKEGGNAGVWLRAGTGGQNWAGAKAVRFKLFSQEPLNLQVSFNDATRNNYTASLQTQGKGWQEVVLPIKSFALNPYYTPEGAKKGAPQDLTRIDSLSFSPLSAGKHAFGLQMIVVEK